MAAESSGEHDGCDTWEALDSVWMAAVAIAISGGAIRQTWYKSVAPLLRLDHRFP